MFLTFSLSWLQERDTRYVLVLTLTYMVWIIDSTSASMCRQHLCPESQEISLNSQASCTIVWTRAHGRWSPQQPLHAIFTEALARQSSPSRQS